MGEIARQLPTTKAAPFDASQQIVKKQTELSKDKNETKTPEDVKTTEEPPTKEEVGRKKKNKARPAPLKDLALIRQEDDFQASKSQTQQNHVEEEQSGRGGRKRIIASKDAVTSTAASSWSLILGF